MEEKRTKISFSILQSKSNPPKPAAAGPHSTPAPRFITTFDPSLTLAPPAAVIAPLPNSRRPSAVHACGGPALVPDDPDAAATWRFKQDMAGLPDDTQESADEYEKVPVEGFGAALLAGYGWKDGDSIGRDKSKGDPKIVERGRRSGTQGLGAGSSDKNDGDSTTVRPAVRRSVRDLRLACLVMSSIAPENTYADLLKCLFLSDGDSVVRPAVRRSVRELRVSCLGTDDYS